MSATKVTTHESVPEVLQEIVFVSTNTLPVENSYLNEHASEEGRSQQFDSSITTQDECMAVEALRQLAQLHTTPLEYTARYSCVHCNSQFSTLQLQQEHLSSCKYQFVCSVCGERFERSTDLDNHVVCHQVGRPHACRTCGNLFRSKSDLLNHAKCHRSSRTYDCSHCGITFLRPSSLTNHMKKHSPSQTDKTQPFRTLRFKRRPAAESSDEQTLSGDHVPTDPLLISQIIHTPSVMYDNNNSVQEQTGKYSKKPRVIDDTSTKGRSTVKGTDSTDQTVVKTEPDVKLEKNSRASMNRPHVCRRCNKAFARSSALASHARLHEDWWGSPLECSKCEETFPEMDSLKQHQADCLGKVPTSAVVQAMLECCALQKKPNPPLALSKGKHVCVYCNKRFVTNQKLYRHMWVHRKKACACSICGLNFMDQLSLDGHCRAEHSGENAFDCQTCGQSFASRQVLCEHQRGVHRSAVFWCKICEKTFTSRSGYVVHVRIHTGERPYSCQYCRKAFRDTGTLHKHERIHTGERPHACPLCHRAFNQKAVLREHVRWVHAMKRKSEHKAYSCQLCRKVFPEHEALCAHIVEHSDKLAGRTKRAVKSNPKRKCQKKTVRKVKSSSQTPAPESKPVLVKTRNTCRFPAGQTYPHTFYPPSLANAKNNQCDMCGAMFQNRNTLLEHVRIHI